MRSVSFRDGERMIPDHLADLMDEIETRTLTYQQAVDRANWKMAQDHISRAQASIIQDHLRNERGS